jgi:transglutaminase-like putative cysteine protease
MTLSTTVSAPEQTERPTRWRLRISHETSLRYDGRARASYNEVRMTPLETATQATLATRVDLSPSAPMWQYTDYWGTRVNVFDLQRAHEVLTIQAESVVETSPAPSRPPVGGFEDRTDREGWERIRRTVQSGVLADFTTPTDRTRLDRAMRAEVVRRVLGLGPHQAAACISAWIHGEMSYTPGATGVHTHGQEAWKNRSGVCQDFSHIAIGMLRAAGLPARYVSGYLFPVETTEPGVTCEGQSHAWAEYWAGGWHGLDATNDVTPGLRHIVVGYGREYGDVVPHKGVYLGAPRSTLTVSVKLTRLA